MKKEMNLLRLSSPEDMQRLLDERDRLEKEIDDSREVLGVLKSGSLHSAIKRINRVSMYVVFECEARERILEHQRSNTGIILIKGMNLRELAMMGADRRITTGMVVILSLRQDFSPHQVIRLRWNRMCQIYHVRLMTRVQYGTW